jgi:hypothetical protein
LISFYLYRKEDFYEEEEEEEEWKNGTELYIRISPFMSNKSKSFSDDTNKHIGKLAVRNLPQKT